MIPYRQRHARPTSLPRRRWFELLESRVVLDGTELANDADTALLLHFNNTLVGAAGETPISQSGLTYQTGLIQQAVHVGNPGNVSYATAGNIVSTAGTVEFWIKPDWNGNTGQGFAFFEAGDSFNNGMVLSIDGANNLRYIHWGDNPDTPAIEVDVEQGIGTSGASWLAGNWYHVAATWDSAAREMAFYVNGRSVGVTDQGVVISSFSTNYLVVGAGTDGSYSAQASIEEFRISSRARTPGEILDDYHVGLGIVALNGPRGLATADLGMTFVAESDGERISVFAADGAKVGAFGSVGSGNGEFNEPWGVALDSNRRVLVVERGNHRVQTFDSGGNYVGQFGSLGSLPGQFNSPQGILVDHSNGDIYVADTGNHRVQRFLANGTLDSTWGSGGIVGTSAVVKRDHSGFDHPTAVAKNPATGEIYVADYGNHRLEVYGASGSYVRTYSAVYRPTGLAFDTNGNLFISGEDPNDGYTAYDGRLRYLRAGDELISRHYTGGLDDLSRLLGGVALTRDGRIVMTDVENGRLVETNRDFDVPIRDFKIDARGTEVTFRWTTAQPGPSAVRYGATNAFGSVLSNPTLTKSHEITVAGLAPNTRLYYGVGYPDSFDETQRWAPTDVLNTGALPGQLQFQRIKGAGVIYTDVQPGPGYTGMNPAALEAARTRFDRVADFYWRNSGFRLWLDIEIIEVHRDVTESPFWVFDAAQNDLAALGYGPQHDFDAMWGASEITTGNFGGGGGLFGRSIGAAQWVTPTDFVAIHEVNHSIDSIYYANGLPKYEFNHGIWAVPGGLGHDYSINGQILRNMLPANYTATVAPYSKVMTAPDADNDGVPDSSPAGLVRPLSMSEVTLGSSPLSADTDGDGLSDWAEATVLPYHNTLLTAPDSDGDGINDGIDQNPAYRINDQVSQGSPTIDGAIDVAEGWTVISSGWGFSNTDLVSDSNAFQSQTTTYAAWDEEYLYLALKGPASNTHIQLDGGADNWFFGPDNYDLWLSNHTFSRSVQINVGVPDVFRQIDDDGQFSEFFDTNPQFSLPYQGRTVYNNPGDGLGFSGRLVTENDLLYQRGGSQNNRVWELAIPWSSRTSLRGFHGKEFALSFDVSGDRLFSVDHAAKLRLVDVQAPRVIGVEFASSTAPHPAYPVPTGNGEQLRTIPIGVIDRVSVRFSENVDVSAEQLAISGRRSGPLTVSAFAYDPSQHIAIWTLDRPVLADELTLSIVADSADYVADGAGNVLDGEWENPTGLDDPDSSTQSGDAIAGGDFEFWFTVLPSDANRDNHVTGADYTIWVDHFDRGQGAADALFTEGDFNGDGHVTGADYTLWVDNFGLALRAATVNGASPALGAPAIAAKPFGERGTGWPEIGADQNEPVAPPWDRALDWAYSDISATAPVRACPWSESERHRRHTVRSRAALGEGWAAELATWRLNASSMTKLVPGTRAPDNSEA